MHILPYIEMFCAVVERGSITAAAKRLGVSKPVVSKNLSALEQTLAVQLLNRTTRRIHLTEAGEVFYRYAEAILEQSHQAIEAVQPLQKQARGRLRLSVPESLSSSLLPNLVSGFQQRFPNISLDIQVTPQYVDMVEQGIDVALRIGKLKNSNIIARKLKACKIKIYAAPSYWDRHPKPQTPDEIKDHNCLIYSQHCSNGRWRFTDKKGHEKYIKVSGSIHSDNGQLLLDAAISGAGIFRAPDIMVSDSVANGQLQPLLEDYTHNDSPLYAVYPSTQHVTPKVRSFIDYAVECLSDTAP